MTPTARPEPPPRSSGDGGRLSRDARTRASVVGVVAAIATGWLTLGPGAPWLLDCLAMAPALCSLGGAVLGSAAVVALVAVRAVWLGLGSAREVRALRRLPVPAQLALAARRSSTVPVHCVAGGEPVAFCAGLWRPRVYVSYAAVATLADDELTAVLAHEDAHARHHDPLRGLVSRAAVEVALVAPLLRWWQHHRHLHAELAADRAAVAHAGAPALAGALLRLAGPSPATSAPGRSAFDPTGSALEARIAALTAATAPEHPLPRFAAIATTVGVLAALAVATCLPALVALLSGH